MNYFLLKVWVGRKEIVPAKEVGWRDMQKGRDIGEGTLVKGHW